MNEPSSSELKTGRLDWLLGARWRAAVVVLLTALIAASVPMLFWVPGALVVFLGLSNRQTACPPGLAAWIAGWTVSFVFQPLGFGVSLLIALVWIGPAYLWVLGLRRGMTLSSGFQTGILLVLGGLALVHLWMTDVVAFWQPILTEAIKPLGDLTPLLRNAGLDGEWDASKVVKLAAERMWGVLAWAMLLNIIGQVAGGLWLLGRLSKRPMLGPVFVTLTIGRQLAWMAMALWVVTSITDNAMASDGFWMFLGAFVVQGLSVCHAIARKRQIRGVTAIYALLVFPWTMPVMQAILALLGYLDNWWDWRRRFIGET